MANFYLKLPDEEIKRFERLGVNTGKMLEDMTQAGARVVCDIVRAKIPKGLAKSLSDDNLGVTAPYRTPSDDGVNTQVMITGYFTNRYGKKTPAPLVANMFEYGSSSNPNYPRKRFFRIAFKPEPIRKAMLEVQDKYLRGEK